MLKEWLPVISTGLNVSLLIVGFNVIRSINDMQFKVNLMWRIFEKKFGNVHLVDVDNDKRAS